ncbi:uncharacterized protein LOC131326035 isoform X5 [Rhododendron vialii]|uniref:uncharacterized protein LOC131326035 isoform X5 n=1 Tax=Rhododendron vialii TaxID=182163 RepID=UPI00266050F3|nr:uncharacterized protein LOC131326035 isoform X5 [Rhododendron vialii]
MGSPTIVLDKIVEKLVDIAFESVGRHLGYLFHYKKNMKNLEVQMNKLQERRGAIERQIDEAKTGGEVIVDDVSDWLKEVDILRQGVESFTRDKTVKENVRCFKFSCPDFNSRYRLSKEAEKKMGDVKTLAEKANFGTISRRAPPPLELQFPSSGEYVSFDSRALVFDRIMEALTDSKVNVIGVYGTGGVGKTTMVEKVGEQVKKNGLFDEVVMAVVSRDAKVAKIQGELADRLHLKLEAETEVGKADQLWNRLSNGKRNLVILDDIWKKLNLKEIGIPIRDGNKGCKVVLTSRNQHVLIDMDVHKDFPIQVLSEEEAWNLFKNKMGNNVDSHDQLHDIAKAVCRECRGLPVAILAVGAALKGKSMSAWKSSLDKLQKSMLNKIEDIDPKLFTSLRLSYDYLDSVDAKSCYLLCCLFPEDAQVPIEELARHCMARRLLDQNPNTLEEARDIVCSVVNTLKTSCLLLDGINDDFVKMHDIVRDIAILIAKEEKAFLVKHGVEEWPETGTYEKYSAISLRSENISELPEELVCPDLHTLMLECSRSKFQRELSIKIPDRFFRGAEKLVVLELDGVSMLPLPSSLGKLMELRMLCLINCELGDIAILKDLKNKLEVLRIRGSDIKALPHEVGELTRLWLLDLGDCYKLKVIPSGVISKLHRLEELHFPLNFENWEGTTGNEETSKVSIDELMSLPRLSTLNIGIPRDHIDELLPADLGFQNLIRFNITVGAAYYVDSKDYSVVVLRDIYDDFNILERLLGKPGRGGLYPSRSFNNLTQLLLEDCRLKYLFSPSCARGLLQLQSLRIWRSEIMEAVIGNEGEKDEEIIANAIKFSQLQSLHLESLPCLISFYPRIKKATTIESHSFSPAQSLFNEKVAFPVLEGLHIESVPNITEIWDKNLPPTESFCRLRSLKVLYCGKLKKVVPSHILPQLKSIETLEVTYCWEMEVIVVLERREEETQEATNKDMIIMFPQLRAMTLQILENLKCVCTYKFEDQLKFNVQFPQLRILNLYNLGRLSSFNDTSTITETRPLFNHQVAFPVLEELYINSVPNITEIWDKNLPPAESICLLRFLEVRNCEKLMNVVPSYMLPLLKSIETLEVSECPEIEVIVVLEKKEKETQEATNKDIIIVQFPQLRKLRLENLERLSSFNNDTCTITETRPLFNHQVAFPALEELIISSVPNITEIWNKNLLQPESFCLPRSLGIRGCEKLRSLKVEDCEKLMNVVPSHRFPLLKNIEILKVSNCPQIEVIVIMEKREEETQEVTNKDMNIMFPVLRNLQLLNLENLKGVCAYKSEDRLCFNVQVAFPALEELIISSVPNVTEIWDKNLLQPESFCLPRSLGIQGCEKLRSLKVRGCEKLMNVVPSHMLPQLKSIKTLEVSECPEMVVIVVLETREEETQEATNKDMIIVFPELRSLQLLNLENLKGVCAYKSEDRLCFNVQVAFPALEELSIDSMHNITEIWDKNLLQPESFCLLRCSGVRGYEKLRSLKVMDCKKLMNVVPSHMLPLLKNIEILQVSNCPEMEVIVVLEKREEETQEATTNNDTINAFPELRYLILEELENLKGVCAYKSEDRLCFNVQFPEPRILTLSDSGRLSSFNNTSIITETRPLFNHQVAFPALEELYINSIPNITEIWDKNLISTESFCLLRSLEVKNCEELMNVVPSHMLPQLKSIKTLEVSECLEMEVIVVLEKMEEETQEATTNKDMIIMFPQLREMTLRDLKYLKCVCTYKSEDQLKFNVQVAFPTLEELSIYGMPNITEIWDKNLLSAESFCLLRSLNVKNCEKLMNVVPSHMLPQLKSIETLEVSGCPEMEVIVVLEKREEETQEATNKNMIIVFPQLRKMTLGGLENLKGVFTYKSKDDQLCFNVQVEFPSLEELSIISMSNITEIWDKNLLQSESFCLLRSLGVRGFEKLRSLTVKNCEKLMNVVPSYMLPLLKNIEILKVESCPEMEVIVLLEKREEETHEAANKDTSIVFPGLRSLELQKLENLKGVCAYKSEDRLCFNVQVAFLVLEELYIGSMPNITEIWEKNLRQPESFCLPMSLRLRGCEKLRSLKVKECEKLMNVIPSHMIQLLKTIQILEVSNCPQMEVTVVMEKREEKTQEATNKDIIVFPELTSLTLRKLENLKGVCAYKSEDRLCFNVQVAFPALEELSIDSMHNITEIWDKNLLQPESFCLLRCLGVRGYEKLRSLKVMDCKKLMNVVPSHMLPLLKKIEVLEVKNCPEMEVIVVLEKREEETQEAANKDMIIVFPQLRKMELGKLENLKGVCAYKSEDRLCFNVQVAFPSLEALCICEMPNITEIWDKNLLQPESFCLLRSSGARGYEKLRSLIVGNCNKLMNVVPSHMHPLLKNIEILHVFNCPEMEVIVVLEKRKEETQEAANNDTIIVFPELSYLMLQELENLKGVCAYKSEDRLCFNVQVVFPKLIILDFYLDEHTRKILREATSKKKECATTDASSSGMQLQP